jgi:hypothetical protein
MFKNWKDDDKIEIYEYSMTVHDVVNRVFNDLFSPKKNKNSHKISKDIEKTVIKEIQGGTFEGMPDFFDKDAEKEYRKIETESWDKFKRSIYALNKNDKEHIVFIRKHKKAYDKFTKEYDKKVNEAALKLWNSVKNEFDGKNIFIVSYSDNGDGIEGTVMEHADIFRNIPHIRISNH